MRPCEVRILRSGRRQQVVRLQFDRFSRGDDIGLGAVAGVGTGVVDPQQHVVHQHALVEACRQFVLQRVERVGIAVRAGHRLGQAETLRVGKCPGLPAVVLAHVLPAAAQAPVTTERLLGHVESALGAVPRMVVRVAEQHIE